MNVYFTIIKILLEVYLGKNLKEVIDNYKNYDYISKIKNHCYGILRNYYSINYCIKKLSNREITDVKLLIILQLGIYEIEYSKKPEYAITNDLVNFTKLYFGSDKYNSFVNAICRNYIRNRQSLFLTINNDYSLRYNLPEWLIDKLKKQNRQYHKQIFESYTTHPGFGLRVNQRKISLESYLKILDQNNIEYILIDNKLCLNKAMNVNEIPLFKDGSVSVQDISAQYTLDILLEKNVKPKKVLDACAAPGGKTCQILENYDVDLLAIDCSQVRLDRLKQNLDRLDLNCKLKVADATDNKWFDNELFDLIIADVPCSATGTIKRNPDIKINRKQQDITNFVITQRKIIENLFNLLDNGGYFMYITCSILKEENQDNIKWLLDKFPCLRLIHEKQVLPSKYGDGLYYGLMKKI